jgi:hypothetical protein
MDVKKNIYIYKSINKINKLLIFIMICKYKCQKYSFKKTSISPFELINEILHVHFNAIYTRFTRL